MKKPASRKKKKPHRSYKRTRPCPHCGQGRDPHFIPTDTPMQSGGAFSNSALKEPTNGFWTCPIYYGPDKRRLLNADVVFPKGYPRIHEGG